MTSRSNHEIEHGKFLINGDAEKLWGWGSPAGQLRAKRRAHKIAVGARLNPGRRVLEIGCGTGMFTEMFAAYDSFIIAVDISEDLLEIARARNLPPSRVQWMQNRFEDCDIEGPFDAIIGSSVLHHLELPDAFDAIFRLLKPGGLISFAEPNMLNPQVWAERNFRKLFPQVSPDETAFIRWNLRHTLEKVGFEQIEIIPFDWLHPSIPEPLIKSVLKLGSLLEKTWLLREFSGSLYIKAVRPQDKEQA
jgi:2-polyprenyl-3-methyl-5-hydroxy-6-metoxy-1,4-benzoquinol methylase